MNNGSARVVTPLFELELHESTHAQAPLPQTAAAKISVGMRPEHILITPNPPANMLSFKARVLLREDLGGEEIVYLDAGGMQLATVLRSDESLALHIHLDDIITASIDPQNVVVYADDQYVGRAG